MSGKHHLTLARRGRTDSDPGRDCRGPLRGATMTSDGVPRSAGGWRRAGSPLPRQEDEELPVSSAGGALDGLHHLILDGGARITGDVAGVDVEHPALAFHHGGVVQEAGMRAPSSVADITSSSGLAEGRRGCRKRERGQGRRRGCAHGIRRRERR